MDAYPLTLNTNIFTAGSALTLHYYAKCYILFTPTNRNWFYCKNITASPFDLRSIAKAASLKMLVTYQELTSGSIVILRFACGNFQYSYKITPLGCALALAKGNLGLSSGPMDLMCF